MKRISFGEKLRFALIEPNYADVGLEFNSDCLRLAVVNTERGALRIQYLDSEPLPAGSIEISPFKPNILSIEAVAVALRAFMVAESIASLRACRFFFRIAALLRFISRWSILRKMPQNAWNSSDLS